MHRVLVEVYGGAPHVIVEDSSIKVLVRDYDIDGITENLLYDEDDTPYLEWDYLCSPHRVDLAFRVRDLYREPAEILPSGGAFC